MTGVSTSSRLQIMTTPNEALRTILPMAGWGDTQAADVMFTGGTDPVLPTPFRIGAAGAATLAASGLAATELWQVRTGRRQRVTVDLRQTTAALRSGHYLRLAGADVSSERNTIMGFYPTRDGRWSYLHCNFPNHRAAALGVLGVAEDREAVARDSAAFERSNDGRHHLGVGGRVSTGCAERLNSLSLGRHVHWPLIGGVSKPALCCLEGRRQRRRNLFRFRRTSTVGIRLAACRAIIRMPRATCCKDRARFDSGHPCAIVGVGYRGQRVGYGAPTGRLFR
jgi:hypothetical protein